MKAETNVSLLTDDSLPAVLCKLLVFSIMIITLPIICYFSSKAFLFEASLGMSSSDSYFYAAIVSIFVIHIILAMFIYVAWKEGQRPASKIE